jgi:HTH-type transcriptional regulator/antitoxin HipB
MTKRTVPHRDLNKEGERRYERWSRRFESDPKLKRIYAEESGKMDLWLQLAEARKAAGLTQAQVAKRLGVSQAQVARIEKRGYESYTINTLKRYVKALGNGYWLDVTVRSSPEQ